VIKIEPSVLIYIDKNDLLVRQKHIDDFDDFIQFGFGNSFIKLKKFTYPKIFFEEHLQKFIGGYSLGEDNFSFEVSEQKLILKTPLLGELQLFYYQSKNLFFAADSFSALVKILKDKNVVLQIDENGLVDLLTLNFDLVTRTFFKGIKKLKENSVLSFSKELTISQKAKLEDQVKPFILVNKNKSDSTFEKYFLEQIKKISLIYDKEKWGSCLSGGTDSAISTYFANLTKPTVGVAAIVNDSNQERQLTVIKKISTFLGINTFTIKASETDLFSDLNNYLLRDPYLDPYGNWSVAFAYELLAQNIDLVFTGLGADDYFSVASNSSRKTAPIKGSINEYFTYKIPKKVSPKMTSLLNSSLSDASCFYYSPWRNVGIWPVSPFINQDLISLSLYLNDTDKKNKIFLKSFFAKQVNQSFSEWQKKIALKTSLKLSLLANLDKDINISNYLNNSSSIKIDLIKSRFNAHSINDDELDFFFMFIRLNKFLLSI